MIVALTGSNGFLGNKFLKNYKKNFKKIISLPSVTNNKNIKFYKDKNLLRDFLIKKKIDVLIHFAGIRKKDCELNKNNAKNSILKFTEQLVKGINKTKKIFNSFISQLIMSLMVILKVIKRIIVKILIPILLLAFLSLKPKSM